MKKRLTCILFALAVTTLCQAGIENNFVIVKPNHPVKGTVYGTWIRDGLVITEGRMIKPETPVSVTFFKGQKKEFSVKMKPVRISGIAYLKPEKIDANFPKGFKLSRKELFKEGDDVEMWDYLDNFACLETEIEDWKINKRANNSLFSLPGYISNAYSIPVTHKKETLVGVIINTNGNHLGVSSRSIAEAVDGMITDTQVKFKGLSQKGLEYNIEIRTFDPFNRIPSMGFCYRVCPYYVDRPVSPEGFVIFDKPEDGKQVTVPMTKAPDGAYRCSLTVNVPAAKSWYWGIHRLTADGKSNRPLQLLLPDQSTMLHGLDLPSETDLTPYKVGAKHPSGTNISTINAPDKPKNFPAVPFNSIEPKSLFPFAVGNEWVYSREQHETNTVICFGRFRVLTDKMNKSVIQQRVSRSKSSHDELYRIDRMVGDRAWLKVYCPEEKGSDLIRDGRYSGASELMLNWIRVNNDILVLEENSIIPSENGTQVSKCDLIVIDTRDSKENRPLKMSSKRHKDYSFKWRMHDTPVKTPVGTFANSVVATEKGALLEGYCYELRTYYYPGVGMIKEEYDLLIPSRGHRTPAAYTPVRAHELRLKSFTLK